MCCKEVKECEGCQEVIYDNKEHVGYYAFLPSIPWKKCADTTNKLSNCNNIVNAQICYDKKEFLLIYYDSECKKSTGGKSTIPEIRRFKCDPATQSSCP